VAGDRKITPPLPHIKEHLAMARKISDSLGAGAGACRGKRSAEGKK